MSVREVIDQAVSEESDDEIVAAISRQLDVLEGTAVIIGNALTMLTLQIGNLRAEIKLFDTPTASPSDSKPVERPQPKVTPSGGVVEGTLEPQDRLPGFCGHDHAVLIDTRDGPTRVCPDCDE